MTGVITSLPPLVEQPPGNNSSNPAGLPGVTYTAAIPNLPQTWTGVQTFKPNTFQLAGSLSGSIILNAAATASGTITFPAGTTDFSNTGGTSQVVFQQTAGGPFTVRQPVLADLGGVTVQYITAGATVTVAATDGLIIINKASGSATTVNLPLASSKVGAVKIVDFKGDAGTNNVTINCAGSDVFNGGGTSWTLAGDNSSIVCSPVLNGAAGIGYAV